MVSLRDQGKSMRIGVKPWVPLAERMLFTYGDTPEGMVESALEFIRICESLDFRNLTISLKSVTGAGNACRLSADGEAHG